MQFKVPQFLDVEDKIFGPFTFKEFAYMAGGGGICYVLYKTLGLLYGTIPIIIVGGLAGMLTFYKPNNKPFIYMLESGFKYFFQDKLYIWEKRKVKINEKTETAKNNAISMERNKSVLGKSKLKDLAWGLDVLDLKTKEK